MNKPVASFDSLVKVTAFIFALPSLSLLSTKQGGLSSQTKQRTKVMLKKNYRDQKRRSLFGKHESLRIVLKSIIYNQELPEEIRFKAQLELASLPKDSSKVRIRNRCVLTGRARGNYRLFKMSRIKFRELASMGMIPGITKASW
jgi:small subunit ribosomal protein S14